MKKATFPFITMVAIGAAILTSCGSNEVTGTVAELTLRRDSIASSIETLRAELSAIDVQIAAEDSTRSFASITTYTVSKGEFNHSFQVYGSVVSDKSVTLYPEMAGSISKVLVVGGQRVKAGQLLVALDASVAQASLAEIKTQLSLAQSVFEKQERLWNQKIGSEVQYLQAKTQFESLQRRMATVQKQIGMTSISAPFDGIIDEVFAKMGEYGAPGMPMVRLIGNGGLRLDMQVPEGYIQRIKKGDVVDMNFSAIDLDLQSKVSQVGNYINAGSRTFVVSVDLSNNANIKANMMASVQLRDYSVDSAVSVPSRLILQDTRGMNYTYVFIQDGALGKISRRDLTLGVSNNEVTEILSGITPGELVVERGIRSVQPDQIVKLY
ncbi:MAG: efflux RND transporter periplasmic adaptor subunit [Schleiferiaceae bacterium]|nr:efflux RND transporter periplasmic adaptor subunit [Schleiferiaceae bacterium]